MRAEIRARTSSEQGCPAPPSHHRGAWRCAQRSLRGSWYDQGILHLRASTPRDANGGAAREDASRPAAEDAAALPSPRAPAEGEGASSGNGCQEELAPPEDADGGAAREDLCRPAAAIGCGGFSSSSSAPFPRPSEDAQESVTRRSLRRLGETNPPGCLAGTASAASAGACSAASAASAAACSHQPS